MSIINRLVTLFVGSRNARLLKTCQTTITAINAFEDDLAKLSDTQLSEKTSAFKQQLADGKTLDDILPEAFATVREASKRTLGLRHYDVQLIGGLVLHQGKIAEMRTGEGKTLAATLPAYLNALSGNGVHIVTVNDYLAKRDADWMGKIYQFLDLSVGVVTADNSNEDKKKAYQCDITYATNNELGFDYLRDNMAFTSEQKAQRDLNFAIVDEVDSILIDEARTPLIISGPTDDYGDIYQKINRLIDKFTEQKESGVGKDAVVEVAGDYTLDEKHKQIYLTDDGHAKAEKLLQKSGLLAADGSLYDASNILLTQHLNAALRAHILYRNDVDYLIKDDEVVIIDEFTGRTLAGRRWSEGLHQAIEAKENVSIKKENQTLASITFQNYFRLYNKLSGMTGTADTESFELQSIYRLEVVVIPTHMPVNRQDYKDVIYLTQTEKYQAIIDEIKKHHENNQPILVGTSSVESSEVISALLSKEKINHEVLNAKQHEREAHIVANAGTAGAITIATNMAGRGTDIVLGGKPADNTDKKTLQQWQEKHDRVVDSGGLHIIGAERNESRRVDNQLRGRAGRQGDPGSSRFFLSLEDNLMRIFASERMSAMMKRIGLEKGEAIEHNWINRAIENAQKKVEGLHFDARKNILEYDDVANEQRKYIYNQRNELMSQADIKTHISETRDSVISQLFYQYIDVKIPESDWNISELNHALKSYGIDIDVANLMQADKKIDNWLQTILSQLGEIHTEKEALAGNESMRLFEKSVMLQTLDHLWKEHLAAMDYLRQSIGLRGYAQKNPIQEYKREAFEMFKNLLNDIDAEVIKIICNVKIEETNADSEIYEKPTDGEMQYSSSQNETDNKQNTYKREAEKIGRNDPCHCGSGKKFKRCHGK